MSDNKRYNTMKKFKKTQGLRIPNLSIVGVVYQLDYCLDFTDSEYIEYLISPVGTVLNKATPISLKLRVALSCCKSTITTPMSKITFLIIFVII